MDKYCEVLTRLYLRLNGYLVSNLIIHSAKHGNNSSEIDIIGIRMPFHMQEDRQVLKEDELECSNQRIEILIADVKNVNNKNRLRFNDGLRNNRESIKKLVNWIGCFQSVDDVLIDEFEKYLNLHRVKNWEGFATFNKNLDHGLFQFKFTFFCPSLNEWDGAGFKYVNGNQMVSFIWECLNKNKLITSCSRCYNLHNWNEFEPLVQYFKSLSTEPTFQTFKEFLKTKN